MFKKKTFKIEITKIPSGYICCTPIVVLKNQNKQNEFIDNLKTGLLSTLRTWQSMIHFMYEIVTPFGINPLI